MPDTLTAFGASIKALGDGKIGGYAVRYGSPGDADLTGDYFTAATDFGAAQKVSLYYDHGMDATLKNRKIGQGELKAEEAGLWYEAQMDRRDAYERMVYQMAEEGKLGFSTGAASHLVTREATGKAFEIKSWPIAEVSCTPVPAEPRNGVEIKSLADLVAAQELDEAPEDEAEASTQDAAKSVAEATITEPQPIQENTTMEDEKKTPEAEAPKVDTVEAPDVSAQIKAALDEYTASMQPTKAVKGTYEVKAPKILTGELGDSEAKAFAHWLRTGDAGGVKHMMVDNRGGNAVVEVKASNAVHMQYGTAGEGGNIVTDDMFNQIIARRDEMLLAKKLGVRTFQGTATTIDIPTDGEADGETVSTAEEATFDVDSPALTQTVLTLVKYTKYMNITWELLQDTSTNLIEFLSDFVARGVAKQHNTLLIAESVANGSELGTTASTTALVLGELEAAAYNNDLAPYLDDTGSVGWVMKPATYAKILSLGGTSNRYYAPTGQGAQALGNGRDILGMPVHFSQKADAYGTANNRFAHFANWNAYMGLYESPSLQFMIDPYTASVSGQQRLLWWHRCDYGVLQAEAGGFVRHITT